MYYNTKNNAQSTLIAEITAQSTSATVAADNFPDPPFLVTFPDNEILKVYTKSGTSWTGVEWVTTGGTYPAGTTVKCRITSEHFIQLQSEEKPYYELEEFAARPSLVTDWTTHIASAMSHFTTTKGGVLRLRNWKIYEASTLALGAFVAIEGSGAGSILRQKSNSNCDFVTLTTDTIFPVLKRLTIDGNRRNQTTGSGLHLYKADGTAFPSWVSYNGLDLTALYSVITAYSTGVLLEDVFVHDCKKHGIDVSSASGIAAIFVELKLLGATIWDNEEDGLHFMGLTDSIIQNLNMAGNGLNGIYSNGGGVNKYGNIKTYFNTCYDGKQRNDIGGTHAGYHFVNTSGDQFVNCEAQEEYQYGYYFDTCTSLQAAIHAGSNGQTLSPYGGVYMKNCSHVDARIAAKCFHSPSWQNFGLTLDGVTDSQISLTAKDQAVSNYVLTGVNTNTHLRVNGATVLGS